MHSFTLIDRAHGPRVVELVLDGPLLRRGFGRLDAPPSWTKVVHADAEQARRALDRALARLRFDGYELGAHHPGMIEAIAAAPDELGNYRVYADWLMGEGDPRGELIQLMVELERWPGTAELDGRLQRLRAQERPRFERLAWAELELRWHWGFVEGLRVDAGLWRGRLGVGEREALARRPHGRWLVQQLNGIRAHPSGRFVRRMWVGRREYGLGQGEQGWELERMV